MNSVVAPVVKGGNPLVKAVTGGKSKKNYKNKSSKRGGKKSVKKGTMKKRGGRRGHFGM